MSERIGRRVLAVLAVLAVGGGAVSGSAAASGAGSSGSAASDRPGRPMAREVTLITGDVVTLLGGRPAHVRPGPGRDKIKFIQRKGVGGDVTVLPLDAANAVRDGQLDSRLFNITKLIEYGLDDKSRPDLPLIVSGPSGLRAGTSSSRPLPSIGGTAVRVAKSARYWPVARAALSARGSQWIRLDGPVRAHLDQSVPQIGAPTAWQRGFTGMGTEVAILDTGIDAGHPDLDDDAVVAARDFTASPSGTADKVGHGTHVASIVTGDHPVYRGVAPDAKLLNGKVLGDDGTGSESILIAGMEWAAAAGAEVVNLSLGSEWPSDGKDVVSQALNQLTASTGALFVVAAGNSGGLPGSPAAADAALTVGAVDRNGTLAAFSSRGPRWPDEAIKPDLTAPGVGIVAAKAKDSKIGAENPNVGEHHVQLSGTSMAAPHVAGAAALLAQQHPAWRSDELKATLMGTAKANATNTVFEQGSGRVDVAAAVGTPLRATPASLSNGIVQWPHHDDEPIRREVTFHNSGTTPVTVVPGVEVRGPDGKAAPAGMFTVSPASLTVPAGGKATAVVTTDTSVQGADGMYSGVITGGGLRIPIAVHREVESYDVTISALDFDGKPTVNYGFEFVNLDEPFSVTPDEGSGSTAIVRVPRGRYVLNAWTSTSDFTRGTAVSEPTVEIDKATEFTFDARAGRPVGFAVDKPDARLTTGMLTFARDTAWGGDEAAVTSWVLDEGIQALLTAPSRTSAAPDAFRVETNAHLTGGPDSRYSYALVETEYGRVPDRLFYRVQDKSLARVTERYLGSKPGTYSMRGGAICRKLPFTLDAYYTPGVEYLSLFSEANDPECEDDFATQYSGEKLYERPGWTTERWNVPVIGPALPEFPSWPPHFAGRRGDEMKFELPLFTANGQSNGFGYGRAEGSTVLFKDGEEVASAPYPASFLARGLPPGPGTFRLRTEAVRDHPVSSRVVADWTFRSDTVTGADSVALPLLAVRFEPVGDRPTVLAVSVDHNACGTGRVRTLSVSYDRGTSWHPVQLRAAGGRTVVVIKHPAGAESVSLRATASDAAGNSVDQTIIDALRLK